jgi:cytochrome b involved in lipid metabolism
MEYYSRKEVSVHNTIDDCWVIANGYVYDITPFLLNNDFHTRMIDGKEGTDISSDFKFHTLLQKQVWRKYIIGRVIGSRSCACM